MKKKYFAVNHGYSFLISLIILLLVTVTGCQKQLPAASAGADEAIPGSNTEHILKDFIQVNLVANNDQYGAAHIDPKLINGWGIAFSPGGTPWVSSQGGHVSGVYNREGVTVLGPVNIPSPGGSLGGNPTGQVFNPNAADFIIPSGNTSAPTGARFIFVGVDGIVSGWNGSRGINAYAKFNNVATSAYTGLTLAANGGSNFLYAADFRAGKIAVWDKNWASVTMPFTDPRLPAGYSPFNIQVVDNQLYVLYAKVGPTGRSEDGVGKGIVNIFTTAGVFIKRFADKGKLNAPWGIAMVPASFFPHEIEDDEEDDKNDKDAAPAAPQPFILVGNFGDGKINVFTQKGKFRGQLKMNDHTLVIERLWAITLPPTTSTIDQNRLYFAAGPKEEADGLFGYIIKDSTAAHD
jgi:uncharacterized protein (TIGR03118 family)